jgi:hypothetical protein
MGVQHSTAPTQHRDAAVGGLRLKTLFKHPGSGEKYNYVVAAGGWYERIQPNPRGVGQRCECGSGSGAPSFFRRRIV